MAGVRNQPSSAVYVWLALFSLTAILGGSLVRSQSVSRPSGPPPPAPQEMVVELRIRGNERFSTERVIRHVHTRADRPYDPQLLDEDVRRLANSRMFLDVKSSVERVEGGVVVIFEVVERPVLCYVKYVGCRKVAKKTLAKETGLKLDQPIDPYAVVEGRRKIEEYYHSKGFGQVHVAVFEGDKPGDKGVVYVINEGPKQRILWTSFEGNTFASDARLTAQIKSRPGFLWLFGTLDRKQIDEDVNRLTAYYRSMGFFQAKVGRELRFNEAGDWLSLSFVIDEGPRYKVRNVTVLGNQKFGTEELTAELKLTPDRYFNQGEMTADELSMRDKYGRVGHVFANVKAEPRFLEEPGLLDLVYTIEEGKQYRVGRIDPHIQGENPHTKITTVLNPLSIFPGQIVDTSQLRATESRWKRSSLFENNPMTGNVPKFTFTRPDSDKEEPEVAEEPRRGRGYRGQSPDGQDEAGRSRLRWSPPRRVDPAVVQAQYAAPEAEGMPPAVAPEPAAPAASAPRLAAPVYRQPEVYRGQNGTYEPNDGYAVPTLGPSVPPLQAPAPSGATGGETRSLPGPGTLFPPGPPDPGYGNQFGATGLGPFAGLPPNEEPPLFLDLHPELVETMTGRFMLSVGVNSDAGLLGSVIVDEQNFDWTRWPRSWDDVRTGRAWRGAGQRFRFEAMPGTQLQRYSINFVEPYLEVLGMPTNITESLSAFYFDRRYREWTERRAGGRVALGYQFLPDLWGTLAYRFEDVHVGNPIVPRGYIPELDEVLGSNTLNGFRAQITRDTRDNTFLATEGYLLELGFEQVIGSFDYPRADVDFRKYFLVRQHPDGSGRHVLSLNTRFGWSGADTPIYEHFYAGGFSTIRGFEFRGVSPRQYGVAVGGHFSLLGSTEYLFPITADDALRGIVFCDTGTVQPSINDWTDRYRVALGFGLRIMIPAMGPAPIALDFAFPIVKQPGDERQVFSFFVGWMR